MKSKQRAVELAIKEASAGITISCDGDEGYYETSADLDDRDIERLAASAIEAVDRWEKQQMAKDKHYAEPVADLQQAGDLVRTHGGLMVTRLTDGGKTYGTPLGDVIHARIAKELIQRGMVIPAGGDLFDGEPQLYKSAIQ